MIFNNINRMKNKMFKIGVWAIVFFAVACLALILICNQMVAKKAEGLLLDHEFPWEDVDSCMNNQIETPIEGLTHCPECGNELRWIRFYSPSWTWQKLCGRAGPLAICEDCHKQVYFKCEIMN